MNKFKEFLKTIEFKEEQRLGQNIFNSLYSFDKEAAESISGTEYDCFYIDSVVLKTIDFLKKRWKT